MNSKINGLCNAELPELGTLAQARAYRTFFLIRGRFTQFNKALGAIVEGTYAVFLPVDERVIEGP